MDTTPFELTPEQKGLLQSLSQETGKDIPTLITEALAGLQEYMHSGLIKWEKSGNENSDTATQPEHADTHIWEKVQEAFSNVPEEELESLPVDGAAQVDHYIYGTPKR